MSPSDLTKLIRSQIDLLDRSDPCVAPIIIARLKEGGLTADMHVGKKDMPPNEVLEWYGGQIISVLESKTWFAVNSLINAVDQFAPEL